MKKQYWVIVFAALLTAVLFAGPTGAYTQAQGSPVVETSQGAGADQPILVDHNSTDITAIPQSWIETAKDSLHIYYGHTSHGSQLIDGMNGLVEFANNGGLGLALPADIFDGLDVHEASPDAGYYPEWVNRTRTYLGDPDPVTGRGADHPATNVVIWSWCGQVSSIEEADLNANYLQPMSQLEVDYPGITFVYMTGHSDGSGETGNLHLRNQQIRQYAIENQKVLYDFYDIELYDPDGEYYGDKKVNDACNYDSDGNNSLDRNWAVDWQNAHTENQDWYACGCAHSTALNCNQKAYAAWWLWARLAGWNGPGDSQKTASAAAATYGDQITYTVTLRNLDIQANTSVTMTDRIPAGLAYVPGSLSAASGQLDDDHLPVLTWSGTLDSTSVVIITYATTVTAQTPQAIVNTAVISASGMESLQRSSTLFVDPIYQFIPLTRK